MAESKSDYFSFDINAHSEKIAKFDPLSTNRLALYSECRNADECPGFRQLARLAEPFGLSAPIRFPPRRSSGNLDNDESPALDCRRVTLQRPIAK